METVQAALESIILMIINAMFIVIKINIPNLTKTILLEICVLNVRPLA